MTISRVDAIPGGATWTNWARTEVATPAAVVRPRSADDVSRVVRAAVDAGRRVKAVGSGHSFTGVAVTDGVHVRLDQLTRRLDVYDGGLVTVGAGWPLHELGPALAAHGLAMSNLGDIDVQTISGAVGTGTHGTGGGFGGISDQIRGLQLVLADGSVVEVSADVDPDLFQSARVGLGAFGVVTAVTLQCEPLYALHAVEAPMPLAEVLDGVDELVAANDHFEFYWFPHTQRTLTKRNNRVSPGTPLAPLGRVRSYVDDELLSNTLFEGLNRLATLAPRVVPSLNAVSARALSAREFTDVSYRVFASSRTVRFRESEWAMPRAAMPHVLREIDAWVQRSGERLPFPVEVRFGAADEPWLSTANGRETAWIAVHQYHRMDHRRYFAAVQSILTAYEGRPHWGKMHTLAAADLAARYPRFADAMKVRDRVDPDRVFGNAYLERVFSG
ncbi:D-arabinono-1,4-lactone oxidase [Angustibacter luteus]|uniref:D-arabinono-1,4-lactone oxidase n=1 Tax=Angustibacter luteus TaxID=658456 RepID=A0ABW1JKC3_9ACTN